MIPSSRDQNLGISLTRFQPPATQLHGKSCWAQIYIYDLLVSCDKSDWCLLMKYEVRLEAGIPTTGEVAGLMAFLAWCNTSKGQSSFLFFSIFSLDSGLNYWSLLTQVPKTPAQISAIPDSCPPHPGNRSVASTAQSSSNQTSRSPQRSHLCLVIGLKSLWFNLHDTPSSPRSKLSSLSNHVREEVSFRNFSAQSKRQVTKVTMFRSLSSGQSQGIWVSFEKNNFFHSVWWAGLTETEAEDYCSIQQHTNILNIFLSLLITYYFAQL